jgi:hypothetical protein
MRVEQGQLLMAVYDIAGVVDVESVMDAGSRSKEPIHWSTRAYVRRIASFNEGAFSSRDNVGGEHSPSPHRAASRRRA